MPSTEIEVAYMFLHPSSTPVIHSARSIDISRSIVVDLDENGDVLGVERIGGPVDVDTLAAVLRVLPAKLREPR